MPRPRARSASRFDHDLDLAHLAAADRGAGHAGDALELRLDDVVGEIVELPLVEPVAADRDLRRPGCW